MEYILIGCVVLLGLTSVGIAVIHDVWEDFKKEWES